jgi:hypothetical protein
VISAWLISITLAALLVFLCILIPVYWRHYGPENFLWFSDIGLFMTVPVLWLHSSLINSMVVIGIMPLEILWTVDFIYLLIYRKKGLGIADYMLDNNRSRFLRGLSLFHIVTPVIWIYCLYGWGYNPGAPLYQITLMGSVLLLTYFFTNPLSNINWVFTPAVSQWKAIPSSMWLVILMGIFSMTILVMHEFLTFFLI